MVRDLPALIGPVRPQTGGAAPQERPAGGSRNDTAPHPVPHPAP